MKLSDKLPSFLSLLTCLLMVLAVSIRRDGKILGHELTSTAAATETTSGDSLRALPDGTIIVNTSQLGKDIIGYSGTVPVEITLKDDRVVSVVALKNLETPAFFRDVEPLLQSWDGKTIEEARQLKVDVVSGATYSSQAVIGNVQRGLALAAQNNATRSLWNDLDLSPKALAGLVVVLLAAIVPLFVKNKRYRLFQQIINVGVLGFWCGTFLNYTSMVGYLSNGMNVLALLVPVVMLITAFVYPLFGKKSHYCTHVCPFGSLQDLAGKCVKRKATLSSTTLKRLDAFRQILWAALMLCLWTGAWFEWIAYEPFSAFIVQSASWVVIVMAVAFVALSTIVTRPYCRFVCPTGTLFKLSQSGFREWKKG